MALLTTSRPTFLKSFARAPVERKQNAPYIPSKAGDQSYSVVVDEFDSAYWSGIDSTIYFNEMYIDDIVNIQYQVSENMMPIYAYGDYRYRFAARGSRIIQGSFSVNFKRSFYIPYVLSMLREVENAPYGSSKKSNRRLKSISTPTTPEEILAAAKQNEAGGFDYDILNEIRQRNAEKFWDAEDGTIKPQARTINAPLYDAGVGGFTVYIKFGQPQIRSDEPAEFDRAGAGLPMKHAGTVEALDGVHITGVGKAVDDSGRNILEVYSFIARDLIPETGQID